MFSDTVMELLGKYFTTREQLCLLDARRVLQDELDKPTLQEALLTVPYLTRQQLCEQARSQNYIKASMNDIDADQPVDEGRFVRVVGSDDADTPLIMNVAHLDMSAEAGGIIILAPMLGHVE